MDFNSVHHEYEEHRVVTTHLYAQDLTDEWKGKTSPVARRKIQNRLNQRAYRERQRISSEAEAEAESSQSVSDPVSPARRQKSLASPDQRLLDYMETNTELRAQKHGFGRAEASGVATDLSALIRHNVLQAAAVNARHLGLVLNSAMRTQLLSSEVVKQGMVPALRPVELQLRLPHDPILDTIPDPQLRHSILCALAAGTLDEQAFCTEIRSSGTPVAGGLRCGFVVWGSWERSDAWELSEHFVRRFSNLLGASEHLIAATNEWRARRGEAPLKLS